MDFFWPLCQFALFLVFLCFGLCLVDKLIDREIRKNHSCEDSNDFEIIDYRDLKLDSVIKFKFQGAEYIARGDGHRWCYYPNGFKIDEHLSKKLSEYYDAQVVKEKWASRDKIISKMV